MLTLSYACYTTRAAWGVLEYLEKIQATLDPFGGRFIVHGGALDVREGVWPGNLLIIEFQSIAEARAWYESSTEDR